MAIDWNEAEARAFVDIYAAHGVSEDLALRTYSARLLGQDPALVMHGGGNTSVKTTATDLFGAEVPVICVKGSGWDLATIEPEGHPAVRLEPLRALRALSALSDEAMVNAQRQNLMDTGAPNPSVETLLHAFLPHKFVDHTHSVAVCAVADQPDAERLAREIWGARIGIVPYIMPGFSLAKAAADAFEADPRVEGLLLVKHGIFSFADSARLSYERMIDLVAAAERFIGERDRTLVSIAIPHAGDAASRASTSDALCGLRGAFSHAADSTGAPTRWLFDRRSSPEIDRLLGDESLEDLAGRGVSTPDHVIRTKGWPLVLATPPADDPLDAWLTDAGTRLSRFVDDYRAYFARHEPRSVQRKTMLDPLPRLVAIPGVGLIGVGKSAAEASVAADVGEAWAATVLRAEAVGRFEPIDEADLFDLEYWSLEQAKLGKGAEKPLARHVVVVTGGAGTIGAATAKAFAAEGAEVALLDIDGAGAEAAAAAISPRALGLACDVTDPAAVAAALARVAERFGGIDVVVSNAGVALTGAMAEISDETLRKSFELNFFGHQTVAREAVRLMRRQGFGGALLFNVSKQAVNPGPDFGAYGTSKAALLALVRQYALEHGRDGVRVNAVNADRIRSGLLTGEMIAARSIARGVSEADYLAGNLLCAEVRAEDVAQAFVASAKLMRTTGNVVTVDGGAVAAMLR
ncbi:bifunctional aldolase/short-chain dehydrogenase [Methylopila sp. M107]|uniref:bifunctional aldolase/short-chain dehydrogenase n=1 Tax=Methylopila sp. M107 TaxID=1101190 RepID=UPI0003746FEF|nr:bifunctional aldolase/short-chain dehydrogenase [Methylopila sp. M107]